MTLTATDGNGFKPPCFAELTKYKELFHVRDGLPHPIGTFNHSWLEVASAFDACFRGIENLRNTVPSRDGVPSSNAHNALMDATRNLYYRATEFIENIDDCVSKSLSPDPKRPVKVSGSSTLRKRVSIPCNKLKHNHNRVHYVEAATALFAVPGFAIYQVKGPVVEPNSEIHKKRRAFSFSIELRRIFATLYLYASDVGRNISSMCRDSNEEPLAKGADAQTVEIIERLIALPLFSFPDETSRLMPLISFDGHTLDIRDEGGIALPAPPGSRMMAAYIGDGYTTTFSVP